MTSRIRIPGALALAAALLLVPAAPVLADQAYDKVASAWAQAGGQLDPCAFTQAELEAAVRGIPPAIRSVVPALRKAMLDGIAAHMRGACKGRRLEPGTTGGAAAGGAGGTPATTTPPVTTPTAPATTAPTTTVPTTTAPTTSTTPAPAATPAPPASGGTHARDRTPLLVALVAAGALLLLALLTWGWARMRGWDPTWAARMRHAWGEAGFRTTSTWSEFTDWLRLGR
ncbi:MAG TPA: hypothetical protein VFF79_04715 [Conexibacter sp.]|nr:hypothetical protein [Conexibacter sp.]